MLPVFDLRLRQRGPIGKAPMNRAHAAVDIAGRHQLAQHSDLGRVVRRVHRDIRLEPITDTSEPHEVLALQVDPLVGFRPADPPKLDLRHRARLLTQIARYLELDRHPVTVPSRHVRRPEAHHRSRPHGEVLEDLVERRAEMNAAIGIGRSVMEHPRPRLLARFDQSRVQAGLLPALEHLGFPLGQVPPHREVGFGKR